MLFIFILIPILLGLFFIINYFAMPAYSPIKTRLIHKNRPSKNKFFWFLFFNHFLNKDIRDLLLIRILYNLNILDKILKSDKLYIVPLCQKTFGLEINKFHLSDYKYRLQTSKNYLTQFLESKYSLNNSNNINQNNITELKNGIVSLFLCSPAFWQFDLTNQDEFVINLNWNDIKYYAWLNYDCKKISVKKKEKNGPITYNSDDYTIKIITDKEGENDSLYNLHQAISAMSWLIPGAWHSWVHFPFTDFTSAWVADKQDNDNIDGVLFKILRIHTRNTKYNTVLVKSRPQSSNSEFEINNSNSSASSAFPTNSREFLNIVSDNVYIYQNQGKHPILSYTNEHPILNFYKEAWNVYEIFVEQIWDLIEAEVNDLIQYIKIYSNQEINFDENKKQFLVRILWAAGFCHSMDHNILALTNLRNEILQPIYESNINENWKNFNNENEEKAKKMIQDNIQRFKNFNRVFVDYSPTKNTVTYNNLDYEIDNIIVKDAEYNLKNNMKIILENAKIYFEVNDFNKYFTKGYFSVDEFSISIDH